MLQSLLDQNLLLPYLGIATLIVAAIMLRAGWSLKSWFAKRREAVLRGELRDAKAAAPNLASTLRMRDETIKQLQDDNRDLRSGFGTIEREKSELERKLQSATSRLSGLTDELTTLRGGRSLAESFDVEADGINAFESNESPALLVERLHRAERAYEKLQAALIEKSNRIVALENSLARAETLTSGLTQVQYDTLVEKHKHAESTISTLEQNLALLNEQKATLESLAERRSRSNHVVREAEREAQALVRKLEIELEEVRKTLSARDGSIHRLFQELRDNQDALRAERELNVALQAEAADRERSVNELRLSLANLHADHAKMMHQTTDAAGELAALQQSSRNITQATPR